MNQTDFFSSYFHDPAFTAVRWMTQRSEGFCVYCIIATCCIITSSLVTGLFMWNRWSYLFSLQHSLQVDGSIEPWGGGGGGWGGGEKRAKRCRRGEGFAEWVIICGLDLGAGSEPNSSHVVLARSRKVISMEMNEHSPRPRCLWVFHRGGNKI